MADYQFCTEELGIRVGRFLDRLEALERDRRIKKVDTFHARIKGLCDHELDYWRSALGMVDQVDSDGIVQDVTGSPFSFHRYLTDYRNAVTARFEGRLDDRNSYQREVGQHGHRVRKRFHLSLRWLKVSDIEKQVRVDRVRSQRFKALSGRKKLDSEAMIDFATTELHRLLSTDKPSYNRLQLCLTLLSGRRPSEILSSGDFAVAPPGLPPALNQMVYFRGQLKTKGDGRRDEWYLIPLLCPPDLAIAGLGKVRQIRPDFVGMDLKKINRIASATRAASFQSMFRKFMPSRTRSYVLRAAYAAFCYRRRSLFPPLENFHDESVLYSQVLGHSLGDADTAAFYRQFLDLVD